MSGICCCKLFSPCRYTFTDHREDILEQLRQNLTLNQLGSNPLAKVANIDWLTLTETTAATWNDTDVIVASGRDFSRPRVNFSPQFFLRLQSVVVFFLLDIVYDPDLFLPFFTTLKLLTAACCSHPVEILVAVKLRAQDTFRKFSEAGGKFHYLLRTNAKPCSVFFRWKILVWYDLFRP